MFIFKRPLTLPCTGLCTESVKESSLGEPCWHRCRKCPINMGYETLMKGFSNHWVRTKKKKYWIFITLTFFSDDSHPIARPWAMECPLWGHSLIYILHLSLSNYNVSCFNTLRQRQNGRHYPDDIFKWIFLNENIWIAMNISMKFDPNSPFNLFQHWFRSWLGTDQATSHYLKQWWVVYWHIYV